MQRTHLREIIRDVDVARAITPAVLKHRLKAAATVELLAQASVARPQSVARLVLLSA